MTVSDSSFAYSPFEETQEPFSSSTSRLGESSGDDSGYHHKIAESALESASAFSYSAEACTTINSATATGGVAATTSTGSTDINSCAEDYYSGAGRKSFSGDAMHQRYSRYHEMSENSCSYNINTDRSIVNSQMKHISGCGSGDTASFHTIRFTKEATRDQIDALCQEIAFKYGQTYFLSNAQLAITLMPPEYIDSLACHPLVEYVEISGQACHK
ncbi:hypothetical protein H4219_002321 [Mycoemilia scoparia]|uniref:Uncharacterized protein n=1 Tax=Mycoemilia scoparia TaxID=417184 RepID=A0A9W8DU69_9FUNG|nr:hypothetical protein H4219_002321 [Mycoemilia scoparia]